MEKSQETTSNVATTETSSICQESRLTPGNTPISPVDKRSSDLEPQWQKLEAGVGLQRDGDDIPPGEDVEQQEGDLSPEEGIFLKEFLIMKAELEMAIRKYRALADDIDKTHKNFTQTSLVTNSVAVASGTMSLLGLALAPVTAGGSLMLTAAGQGLGAVAGATSLLTSILEYHHNKQAQAQVSSKLSAPDPKVEEAVAYAVVAGKTVYNCGKTLKGIKALQVARAHPRLAAAAKRLLVTGEASARTTRRVQRAFRGTPLAMGSSAFLRSGVLNGLFLGMDVSSLLKDWQELKQEARTELADLLRAKAERLERELAALTQLYEELQKLLQEKSLRSSSSEEATATLTQPPAKQGEAGPRAAELPRPDHSLRRGGEASGSGRSCSILSDPPAMDQSPRVSSSSEHLPRPQSTFKYQFVREPEDKEEEDEEDEEDEDLEELERKPNTGLSAAPVPPASAPKAPPTGSVPPVSATNATPTVSVPSASVPSASAPKATPTVSVPSASVPSVSAPKATPTVSVPSASVPSVSAPKAHPTVSVPSASVPSASAPKATPTVSVPSASATNATPTVSVPSASVPSASAPKAHPTGSVPSVSATNATPTVSVPSASVPSASAPKATPTVSVPSASVPSASAPKATPTVSVPSASVPSASAPKAHPTGSVPPASVPSVSAPKATPTVSVPSASVPSASAPKAHPTGSVPPASATTAPPEGLRAPRLRPQDAPDGLCVPGAFAGCAPCRPGEASALGPGSRVLRAISAVCCCCLAPQAP